ncbi:MAG: hypothetical protein LCH53_09255 [Bacteroidetes bacterium]|nr:hypothetical protein [Bacteroidota bacterium]
MRTPRLRSALAVLGLAATLVPLQGCGLTQRYASGGGGGGATLVVVNRGSQSVYSLQASSCSDSNWGEDHLGSSVIRPGATKSFTLTPGCWDFRADYDSNHSNGNERIQRNVRIGAGSSWTWTVG